MTEMLHLSALMPLLPELVLIVGALALLMIGAVSGEKSSGGITALGPMFAMCVLSVLPVVLFFVSFQRLP